MQTTITVQDLFNIFLAFCGAIAAIGAATAVIARWVAKARAPEGIQNARIEAMEKRIFDIERMLDNDNKRLTSTEEGMRCIIKGMVAVLNGSIHGNNKDQMEKALLELNDYLTGK